MGRLDTSKSGELRVMAEKLRRSAAQMTLPSYVDLMRKAASELDAEAFALEMEPQTLRPGRHLDISV